MKIHGRFYLSKKTPDYKMTHQLFTLFWIISNILTFHFYTFSVIYTFYFYIAFEELTFYQKCSIKCVLYSLFYNISPSKEVVCNCKWHCLKCVVCRRVIGNDQHSKVNDCTTQFEAGAKIECNQYISVGIDSWWFLHLYVLKLPHS